MNLHAYEEVVDEAADVLGTDGDEPSIKNLESRFDEDDEDADGAAAGTRDGAAGDAAPAAAVEGKEEDGRARL